MDKVNFNYDNKNDILYITIGKPKPSYASEGTEILTLKRDILTDKLNGVTILNFMKLFYEYNTTKVIWTDSRQNFNFIVDESEALCKNCDEYLNENWKYCPSCGYKIDWRR